MSKLHNTRLADLDDIIDALTVAHIAEHLASFDRSAPHSEVVEYLEENRFDVVGIRVRGVIEGYATAHEAFVPFDAGKYPHIRSSEPLSSAIEKLKGPSLVFVETLGKVYGIITRADIEKQPVRLWLFGLISLLEMKLTALIELWYPDSKWKDKLSDERLAKVEQLHQERVKRNIDTHEIDCLQLGDKKKLLGKHGRFDQMGMKKVVFANLMEKIEKLRNQLAHSGKVQSVTDIDQLLDLIAQTKGLIQEVDKALASNTP